MWIFCFIEKDGINLPRLDLHIQGYLPTLQWILWQNICLSVFGEFHVGYYNNFLAH